MSAVGWPVLDFHKPFRPLLLVRQYSPLAAALVFIPTIAFVLLLLHLLLLHRPFINEIVERTANQIVLVCHTPPGTKMGLLTELGLW